MCLGVLFFFKYFNFFSNSFSEALRVVGISMHPVLLKLLLPVGISFYTFQSLSYVIDVYRGDVSAEKHFGYYATFVSFFPQLVAGPIERTGNLLPQIQTEKIFDYNQVSYGLKLMAWGFFKKLCIADAIAVYVDAVYHSVYSSSSFSLLMAMLGFTVQIYCDFSGYSDIAIGSAKMLGIDLMNNFKSPYFSASVKEFWSRWHISLSTWFRDYLYIPLGGNRCGRIRHYFNLMITFLASGLWHGANWTFVLWGRTHGLAQIIENVLDPVLKPIRKKRVGKCLATIAVFAFCNLSWVFFRAESIMDALYLISHMFSGIGEGLTYFKDSVGIELLQELKIAFSISILTIYDVYSLKLDVIQWLGRMHFAVRWISYVIFVFIIFLFAHVGNSSFIYFQF